MNSCVINVARQRSFASKESRAARVRRAAHAMLDIPVWPVRRRITRDWKSFSHGNRCAKYRHKKLILSKEVPETFIDICNYYKNSQNFKYNNVNTIRAKGPAYFGRVSCWYGEKSPPHLVLWLELFFSSNPLANDPDKYGEQLACMYDSCKKTRNNSWSCHSVIGHKKKTKKQRFCGTNQKPELPRRFGTGPLKPCLQGLFSSFLTFLRPNFFPASLTAPGSPRMVYLLVIK